MKISGTFIKLGFAKAIDWFEKQRYQTEVELTPVSDICDNFERGARRVPRNICSDPAIEAKRVLSESVKTGLVAFRKGMTNCLREGEREYILQFAESLQSYGSEYLGLLIDYSVSDNNSGMNLELKSACSAEKIVLKFSASGLEAEWEQIIQSESQPLRAASDEDFGKLILSCSR